MTFPIVQDSCNSFLAITAADDGARKDETVGKQGIVRARAHTHVSAHGSQLTVRLQLRGASQSIVCALAIVCAACWTRTSPLFTKDCATFFAASIWIERDKVIKFTCVTMWAYARHTAGAPERRSGPRVADRISR